MRNLEVEGEVKDEMQRWIVGGKEEMKRREEKVGREEEREQEEERTIRILYSIL